MDDEVGDIKSYEDIGDDGDDVEDGDDGENDSDGEDLNCVDVTSEIVPISELDLFVYEGDELSSWDILLSAEFEEEHALGIE